MSEPNSNNRLSSHKKSSPIRFTRITDTKTLVKDDDLLGNSEVFRTYSENYVDAAQHTILVMERKGSKPMRVCSTDVLRPYESDFKSMINIMRVYKEFPIIECGKSSIRRDVLIVDIDGSYELYDLWNVLTGIKDLPECVLTQNKATGHWQIQFYLNKPVYTSYLTFKYNENGKRRPEIDKDKGMQKRYMYCLKRLAKFFGNYFEESDMNFQGNLCRNPWNIGQDNGVTIRNGKMRALRECRPEGSSFETIEKFLDKNNVELRKNVNLDMPEIEIKNEGSRHKLEMQFARDFMWNSMRDGYTPTENELAEYLISIKEDIAGMCLKEPHSDSEILSQVTSFHTWCTENFHDVKKGTRQWKSSVYWNRNQQSSKLKRAKKLKKKFAVLMEKGYSLKQIAKEFNMSRVTLYTYLALFFVIDTVQTKEFPRPQSFAIIKSWGEIILEVSEKIKQLMLKFGNSKIKWKSLNYKQAIDNFEKITSFDMSLEGNYWLDYAA